ncbi:MAG: FAD-dependent oxidoreductase, partial [Bacteroidia bacterium]
QGRGELEKKLQHITTEFYEVKDHRAGVRPSVIDRRPVIGAHPQHRNMYVFNGMGTKGVMLAPYFAEQLIRHIYQGTSLIAEVKSSRFDALLKNPA